MHRIGKFPSGRTGPIEAGYRPDRIISSSISNIRLFSESGKEYNEKQSKGLLKIVGKILFFFQRHNAGNVQKIIIKTVLIQAIKKLICGFITRGSYSLSFDTRYAIRMSH